MSEKGTPQDPVKMLAKMIKGMRIAMLSSVEADGTIHARPMATQDLEFNGTLWFFTQASSHKVEEVDRDPHVNVAFSDEGNARYVSMSGTAELVRDAAKIREYWSPILKAWFKGGPEDPDLALLKVSVQHAQYWDAPSSRMVRLAGIVRAAVTGEQYQGNSGTVNLPH
ncbi:MAG TPA: pyridoxamine 5'-phosphate oxidase family protein [Myxococcaceae bacterium]|nr:pyridoxamine 5'-phosphate oxidase family protein [Myxococcaceae bacterium]